MLSRARQTKGSTRGGAETMAAQLPPVTGTSSTASPTPGPRSAEFKSDYQMEVIRHNFPCSASLIDVATFVLNKEPRVILVQILTHLSLSLFLPLFPSLSLFPDPFPS